MSFDRKLKIELRAVSSLRPYPHNARVHSKKQVAQVAKSIEQFGFTNPILIDDQSMVLAGHGRLAAAQSLKIKEVPCVVLSNMSAVQKRAYVLADNKLVLNGAWDEEILATELQGLLSIDCGFDLDVTGFSIPDIDRLIEGLNLSERNDPFDDHIPALADISVSKPGDLWNLGSHRIFCGSALDEVAFQTLMGNEKAEMAFTDPPYNVPINGHVGGLGKTRHREFAMAAGEMSKPEFTGFLRTMMRNLARSTVDGSIHFHCMDWRHIAELLAAGEDSYTELKNVCVWVKDNGGMGTFYRSRHELICAFKSGTKPHVNTFELGQHGRYRTNVWEYRGYAQTGKNSDDNFAVHPTVKPVQMVSDAIKDVSRRGGLVLDCFGGSGTTLIAAHKTGRRARLIEIDPLYVDVAIRRWQDYAKDDAILEGTGETFSAVSAARSEIRS